MWIVGSIEGIRPVLREEHSRTYWANSVRRDSRQYLYKEGSLDEEALAKITAGVDGAMIAVDEPVLDGIIRAAGVEPLSGNF